MDERVVRKAVKWGVLLALLLLVAVCQSQSARQIVEGKLAAALSHSATKGEVKRYLQQEHAEIFQEGYGALGARFRNIKNDGICKVDVNVMFAFDLQDQLLFHESHEMRICL